MQALQKIQHAEIREKELLKPANFYQGGPTEYCKLPLGKLPGPDSSCQSKQLVS